MTVLFYIVPMGVLLSLIAFFLFELRAIKANKQAAFVTGEIPMYDIDEKFTHYDTINNVGLFTVVVYLFTLLLALVYYEPSFGLVHALLYIFCTTFIGSAAILLIKIKHSLLIRVFASFLYGTAHILGSSFAFLTSYLIS